MRTMRFILLSGILALVQPVVAFAHCDALDGPVVKAAKLALESRDVTKVLPWVAPEQEAEIRGAFDRALRVRATGGEAQALADTWFFETLVRVHRAGEGAPFDGLKPAGHIEPLVTAIDATLDGEDIDELLARVSAHVSSSLRDRYERARMAKSHAGESVEAGRQFVAAYVAYVHHVEALHRAATGAGAEHGPAPAATAAPGHSH